MSAEYHAYPEYKDSGVEWLVEIPAHWDKVPIKYMALAKDSLFLDGDWIESKDLSLEGIRYITTGNIGEGHYKEQGEGYITKQKFHQIDCTEVFEGDLLISRLNAPIGRSCIVPYLHSRIVTSVDNVIFRPDHSYLRKYLVYLFSSKDYFKHTSNLARGATMQRISRGLLGNIRVVVPTLEEQTQIANFLDHETAKIDTLIEKQQQLIKLLKEKRQAVISHAVTKGLNPQAPMKNSGVEWLGEVPAHWSVTRLKYECSHIVDCMHSTPKYDNDGKYPAIRTADISSGKLDITNARRVTESVYRDRNNRLAPQPCDIIYSREGERFGIGALVPKSSKVCLAQRVMLFRAKTSPEYLMWSLNAESTYKQAQQDVIGSTSPHVNVETIKNLYFAWPPAEERKQISLHISRVVDSLERIISIDSVKIGLLQERRTALISAAVTGKIDVRNWQAPAQTQTHKEKAA